MTSRFTYLFVAAALTLPWVSVPAFADDVPALAVDHSASRVEFVARQASSSVPGDFKESSAAIHFDPNALDVNSVRVEIVIASVTPENAERDDTIRSKDLFDSATWPTALFEADEFSRSDADSGHLAHGRLAPRDVSPARLIFPSA